MKDVGKLRDFIAAVRAAEGTIDPVVDPVPTVNPGDPFDWQTE